MGSGTNVSSKSSLRVFCSPPKCCQLSSVRRSEGRRSSDDVRLRPRRRRGWDLDGRSNDVIVAAAGGVVAALLTPRLPLGTSAPALDVERLTVHLRAAGRFRIRADGDARTSVGHAAWSTPVGNAPVASAIADYADLVVVPTWAWIACRIRDPPRAGRHNPRTPPDPPGAPRLILTCGVRGCRRTRGAQNTRTRKCSRPRHFRVIRAAGRAGRPACIRRPLSDSCRQANRPISLRIVPTSRA